jgi:integrase
VKVTLTPRSLSALLNDRPPHRVIVRDQSPQSPPGFVMRVSETAASYYVIAKKRWHLVGDARALSLEEARRVARVLHGKVASGIDPTDERRAARERRKVESAERRAKRQTTTGPTVVGIVRRSLEAKEGRLSERTIAEWTRTTVRDIAPSIVGQSQASALKRDVLADWLDKLAKDSGPHQSDRILNLVRAAYRWALDEEAAGHSMGILRDPTRGLRPQVARAGLVRDRTLIADEPSEKAAFAELISWWRLSEGLRLEDRVFARLILLAGTRRDETALARWSEVDLDGVPAENLGATWRIPAERRKGGEHGRARGLIIPLSTLAVAELRELRKERPADTIVFETLRANPGERLHAKTIPDLTHHDLRRTTGSAVQRLGAGESEVKLVLGHVLASGATKHYAHSAPLEAHRRWLQALADVIVKYTTGETGKVLKLKKLA